MVQGNDDDIEIKPIIMDKVPPWIKYVEFHVWNFPVKRKPTVAHIHEVFSGSLMSRTEEIVHLNHARKMNAPLYGANILTPVREWYNVHVDM